MHTHEPREPRPLPSHRFDARLDLELAFTVGGKRHEVPGGQIKALGFTLEPWGFEGRCVFTLSYERGRSQRSRETAKALLAAWTGHEPIDVTLSVRTADEPPDRSEPEALSFDARISERWLSAVDDPGVEGRPVRFRRFGFRFVDPAAWLWRRHFPAELQLDTSFAQLLETQHDKRLRLECTHPAARRKRTFLFTGLGTGPERVSFYDWVMAEIARTGGRWLCEPDTARYRLEDKAQQPARFVAFDRGLVHRFELALPEAEHAALALRNVVAPEQGDPERERQEAEHPVRGLVDERLVREPVPNDSKERWRFERAERARTEIPAPLLDLVFDALPPVALAPGTGMRLEERDGWSRELVFRRERFRVRRVLFDAEAMSEEAHAGAWAAEGGFLVRMRVLAEQLPCDRPVVAPHRRPPARTLVEGRIVSEVGEKEEETFEIRRDERSHLESLCVRLPAWDDKIVPVPFAPDFLPGHFFVPPVRDRRVLVALGHDRAEIVRHLEWRTGARPPRDTQGNQIVFGKTERDRTVISHRYEQGQPVWELDRRKEDDRARVRLEPEAVIIEASGDGS
ncbi:MAG: hypothetical protein D6776_05775 [Planctomycetota bacterium]|nr:MAG: hypothetical protein D6776_05775 [Planctomycetota bacterium]